MNTYDFTIDNSSRFQLLWRRVRNAFLVIISIILCIILGQLVDKFLPMRYTVSAVVTEPHIVFLGNINAPADIISSYADLVSNAQELDSLLRVDSSDVFNDFAVIFSSSDSIKNFYIEKSLYSLYGFSEIDTNLLFLESISNFINSFSLELIPVGNQPTLVLYHTNTRAETASELLNVYLQFVADKTLEKLVIEQQEKRRIVMQRLDEQMALHARMHDYSEVQETKNVQQKTQTTLDISAPNNTLSTHMLQLHILKQVLRDYQIAFDTIRPIQVVSYAKQELAVRSLRAWHVMLVSIVIGCVLGMIVLLVCAQRDR